IGSRGRLGNEGRIDRRGNRADQADLAVDRKYVLEVASGFSRRGECGNKQCTEKYARDLVHKSLLIVDAPFSHKDCLCQGSSGKIACLIFVHPNKAYPAQKQNTRRKRLKYALQIGFPWHERCFCFPERKRSPRMRGKIPLASIGIMLLIA